MPTVIGELFAGELTDGEAALRVYLAAGGLLLLGVLLLTLTVRWWRATRPEPPSLAPLEVMGERRWAKAPDPDRQRLLEQHRPASADGTTPIVQPEPVDLAALARVPPRDFGDLVDDGARLGDDVRVVGPVVGASVPVADSSVAQLDEIGIDETVALESDDDVELVSPIDSTMALIAPDAGAFDRIDTDAHEVDTKADADADADEADTDVQADEADADDEADEADADDAAEVDAAEVDAAEVDAAEVDAADAADADVRPAATVIDTGETTAVAGDVHDEANDAGPSQVHGPTGDEGGTGDRSDVVRDDTGDVVQQALELDDELVDQSTGD